MDAQDASCSFTKLCDEAPWLPDHKAATREHKGEPSKFAATPDAGVFSVVQQVFPPFLVAGLGMVAAGLLLGKVHRWPCFAEASEMLILVPALLGLKGNLEMTLASRISTHANLGHLDGHGKHGASTLVSIVSGNLAVVMCQAIVVGFLASAVAIFLDLVTAGEWHPEHMPFMASSAVAAASTASCLLATTMIVIVMLARRYGVNPDNVASPIAGMLGDFCTLGLLAVFAHMLWTVREACEWLEAAVILFFAVFALVCAKVALNNPHTHTVLREGWTPVIMSMLISSGGGLILKHAVKRFIELAAFAPVMNGAGGNLAAVQTSRISTDLHAHGDVGTGKIPVKQVHGRPASGYIQLVPDDEEPLTPGGTFSALLSKNEHAGTARILIGLAVPGAICFVFQIVAVRSGGSALPDPLFMLIYVCAALLQVCSLFVAAHGIVNSLWRCSINPDNAAIPYVTALGDLVGTTCLTAAFWVLESLGGVPWVPLKALG
eukprot:CAMPEP_0171100682 /NCGR_PEP_ID=MMETSP0766_2-20121228/53103_1 /TAXON_ID=439317 /ORGANISM="Gambierdiscus australes, Strain CAWD 149" /LENGTH=490 /DNA_ID=CAMNT_0011560553 /DNA_START=43 /DNA_END=1515 /DNA_ORIENTATION=+